MSLVAWWKLNGDAYDSSPSRNHGTVSGTVNYSSATDKAQLGSAAVFTGTGGSRIVPTTSYNITTHHTVTFWMYGESSAPAVIADSTIFGTLDAAGQWFAATDNLSIRLNDSTINSVWDADIDFYQRWRHVALRFETSFIELFLDGVSQGLGNQAYDGSFTLDGIGGGHSNTDNDYVGNLNDFRIYDHVLSVKEIQEIARCKIFHVTGNSSGYKSEDIFAQSAYSSIDSGIVHDTTNMRVGKGCIDLSGATGVGATSEGINYGNPDILRVNANASFCFWMYANDLSLRYSILQKAYAGEVTITQETNNLIRLLWGQTGLNGGTVNVDFKNISCAADSVVAGEWMHWVICRDDPNKTIFWYKNGVINETKVVTGYWPATTERSALDFQISGGYVTPYEGLLGDIRIYNTILSAADAAEIYATSAQLDRKGNLWC